MARLTTLIAAAAMGVALAAPVSAAPLTTSEILRQFNLVTFGDVTGTSHVDGRALIGGDLDSSWMVFNMHGAPASAYAALTVGGDITGSGVHVNNGGDVVVGGAASTTVNRNGGGTLAQDQGTAGIPDFAATLKASSAALAEIAGVSPAIVNGNKAVFDTAPTDGLTVYSIDLSFFDLVNEIELALNGADTVVINVSGTSGTLQDNFLGDSFNAASNVIWNFYEATSLTFDRQFVGTVLAPYAAVTVTNNNIEGTLVADSAHIGGEIHQRPFAGTLPSADPTPPVAVPAPAALPVFLAGLAGLGLTARRRRVAAA